MPKFKGNFFLEVEAPNETEARRLLFVRRNLIQFGNIEKLDDNDKPSNLILDFMNAEDRETIFSLMKEKTLAKFKNAKNFLLVYTNNDKKSNIYQAINEEDERYQFVFYIPEDQDDTKSIKVYQTDLFGFTGAVIGNFINRDMAGAMPRVGKSY